MNDAPIFIATDSYEIKGRGTAFTGKNPFGEVDRSYPVGKYVSVDGVIRKIKACEGFALPMIRANAPIGLLFEDEE